MGSKVSSAFLVYFHKIDSNYSNWMKHDHLPQSFVDKQKKVFCSLVCSRQSKRAFPPHTDSAVTAPSQRQDWVTALPAMSTHLWKSSIKKTWHKICISLNFSAWLWFCMQNLCCTLDWWGGKINKSLWSSLVRGRAQRLRLAVWRWCW